MVQDDRQLTIREMESDEEFGDWLRELSEDSDAGAADEGPEEKHLVLTDESCAGFDPVFKMNPPLREQADVDALRAGRHDSAPTASASVRCPGSTSVVNTTASAVSTPSIPGGASSKVAALVSGVCGA